MDFSWQMRVVTEVGLELDCGVVDGMGGCTELRINRVCSELGFRNIPEMSAKDCVPLQNHWAIPRVIWKVMEEAKAEEQRGQSMKKQTQQKLDFKMMTSPHEFTRSAILHAVVKFIATNNQVSH